MRHGLASAQRIQLLLLLFDQRCIYVLMLNHQKNRSGYDGNEVYDQYLLAGLLMLALLSSPFQARCIGSLIFVL